MIVSANEQLRLLRDIGVSIDPAIFELMKPPTVVVFAGHMLDEEGRADPASPGRRRSTSARGSIGSQGSGRPDRLLLVCLRVGHSVHRGHARPRR